MVDIDTATPLLHCFTTGNSHTCSILTEKIDRPVKPFQITHHMLHITCLSGKTCSVHDTSLQALPSDMQQKSMRGGLLATHWPMAAKLV